MALYQRPDSDVWWMDVTVNGKRIRKSTGTADKAQARRLHDEATAKQWKSRATNMPWSAAASAWLALGTRSNSELFSLHKFQRHYPDRPLSQVTGVDIAQALSFCETAGTYMRYRSMVQAILNVAHNHGWLDEVPKIPSRRTKPKTRDWLTPKQWDDLYEELPQHLKAPARFAINTGLRQANVFGLVWRDVDLERKVVVARAEHTKAGQGIRVPLNDEAIQVLQAQQGQHDEFVFTYRGKPMVKPKAGFRDACVRAGVPEFVWHGFRHTWATWHAQNGTPIEVLQKLGGWADLRMVMHYAVYSPSYVAQFANNVRKK